MKILTFIGQNTKTKKVIVLSYDIEKAKIRKIGKIEDDTSEDVAETYVKYMWEFSAASDEIRFFMTNEVKSKIVVWSVKDEEIRDSIDLKWSLLIKKAIVQSASEITSTSENDNDYEIPQIWFRYDCKGLIMRNPVNKTFITLNKETKKKTVKAILNKNSMRKYMEPEPVFLGYNIYVLRVEENMTIVKII